MPWRDSPDQVRGGTIRTLKWLPAPGEASDRAAGGAPPGAMAGEAAAIAEAARPSRAFLLSRLPLTMSVVGRRSV